MGGESNVSSLAHLGGALVGLVAWIVWRESVTWDSRPRLFGLDHSRGRLCHKRVPQGLQPLGFGVQRTDHSPPADQQASLMLQLDSNDPSLYEVTTRAPARRASCR